MKIPRGFKGLWIILILIALVQIGSIFSSHQESRFYYLSYERKTPAEAFLLSDTDNAQGLTQRSPASTPRLSPQTPRPGLAPPLADCDDLYSFICEKEPKLSDPTGSLDISVESEQAGKALFNDFKKQYPTVSQAELQEKLAETIFNPRNRIRIEKAFVWVKRELIHFFEQQSHSIFTPVEKSRIQNLLFKTRLRIPPPAKVYESQPDLLTSDEVFYEKTEQGERFLRVGGGYVLNSQSWFNLIFTFAHELAHAIDICEIKDEGLSLPAFDQLNGCFLERGLIDLHHERRECVSHDHLAEVFADWIAVQITSIALKTFAEEYPQLPLENAIKNSVRDLCTPPHHEWRDEHFSRAEFEFHPTPQVRVEKLFAHHPVIRELLGCRALKVPQASFCTFANPWPAPSQGGDGSSSSSSSSRGSESRSSSPGLSPR